MRPILITIICTILATLTFQPPAFAKLYKYSELLIKDYDEMLKEVHDHIARSKAAAIKAQEDGRDEDGDIEAVEILRNSLKMILSRPNKDNMLSKLLPLVRKELNNYNAFEDTLITLVGASIGSIRNNKVPLIYRSTDLIVLENVMSELKPEADTNKAFRDVFVKIRDAKIEIPENVRKDMKIRSMLTPTEPSEVAASVLKKLPPLEKKAPPVEEED